jgi:hypothetical protein
MTAPQPIEFPLVQEKLTDYLNTPACQEFLAAVPNPQGVVGLPVFVGGDVPQQRPPRIVIIFTAPSSGAQSRVLSTRRIICQVDNGSQYASGQLAEKVRALIVDSMYRRIGIKRVEVQAEPAHFPGPSVPWRWQFTADVVVRAIAGAWS